jgi:Calx-beta domain-containing protein
MEKQKRTPPTGPGRPGHSEGSDAWRLDPSDVARHARLRRQSEQRGPLGRAVRYLAVVLVLAGGFAVYWNFDTLRQVTVQAPALSALLKGLSPDDPNAPAGGATQHAADTAVVESAAVVGTAAPTSVSADRDRQPPLEVAKAQERAKPPTPTPHEASAPESPPAKDSAPTESGATAVAAVEPPPAPAPAAPAPVPATPPTPETIEFALPKFKASERDAFAAVVVVRNGGNRGPSAFTWWTSDGTAKAGSDYVDLGRVVVKFAAGEQNRVINIPIIGDQVAEDTESFYVNLAPGNDASAEAQDRVEVVIEDDDKP